MNETETKGLFILALIVGAVWLAAEILHDIQELHYYKRIREQAER